MTLDEFVNELDAWSNATFRGYHQYPQLSEKERRAELRGCIEHIRSELDEVEADPRSKEERIDVLFMALKLCLFEMTPQQMAVQAFAKLRKNQGRTWPPMSEQEPGKPVFHVKGGA